MSDEKASTNHAKHQTLKESQQVEIIQTEVLSLWRKMAYISMRYSFDRASSIVYVLLTTHCFYDCKASNMAMNQLGSTRSALASDAKEYWEANQNQPKGLQKWKTVVRYYGPTRI